MNYIKGCLLLPFCALCVYAVSDGLNADQMTADLADQLRQCDFTCRLRHHRSCSKNPPQCGDCLPGFRERDGLCLTLQRSESPMVDEPDEDVDRLSLAARLEREEQSLSDESADEDSKVFSRKDESKRNSSELHFTETATRDRITFYVFIFVVAGCSVAGLVGLIVAGFCWYRIQKDVKATSETEYPAYGVTGPAKGHPSPPGDRKLAQSAQMYHYQHQKQQMLALEKAQGMMNKDASDIDSDEENEEGDYTVYECPGLAPTGEMEVNNPLFGNDAAPAPPTGEEKVTPQPAKEK